MRAQPAARSPVSACFGGCKSTGDEPCTVDCSCKWNHAPVAFRENDCQALTRRFVMKRIAVSHGMTTIAVLVFGAMLAVPASSCDRACEGGAAASENAAAVPRTLEETVAR